jgi:LemA protein
MLRIVECLMLSQYGVVVHEWRGKNMKRSVAITLGVLAVLLLIILIFVGWGISVYNRIVTSEEGVKAAWSQVENQYQRRYDLIPNLVETVKGFAKQEKEVLEGVTEARSRVGQMTVTPEILNDPQAFAKFQQAQDGLSSALSRLLVVTENYPTLRSNENFLALQQQLEGTENRISVERRRFNETVQEYNVMIRRFPASFVASMGGFREKAYFGAVEGAQTAPSVKF